MASLLLDTVRETLSKRRMLRRGDRVVVGVSGGPDSLALLAALTALRQEYRLILRAAYVNHGLRPQAARKEAALVRRIGRMWNVPVHLLRCSVKKRAGLSMETVAREVRYRALASLACRTRSEVLALGHTRDDQAETVLMWLLRGTGTAGLAGIPPVRLQEDLRPALRIVRPLLGCSRAEVESYLRGLGLRPLQDESNLSLDFFRNRIRRKLIPQLEEQFNPRLREHLANLAEILRDDRGWLEREALRLFSQVARKGKKGIRLRVGRMRKLHPALRQGVLRLSVQRTQGHLQGFRHSHWVALEGLLLKRAGAVDLPHRFRAEILKDGDLLLSRREPSPHPVTPVAASL